MNLLRINAEDFIRFGTNVLVGIGFPENQAHAEAMILVEADLRGDDARGIWKIRAF